MPGGALRVVALYVSGLFVVFYVLIIAQYAWVCEMNEQPTSTGYVRFFGATLHILLTFYERSSSRLPRCIIKEQIAILQMTCESL
jgi:hypothetical protein